MTGGGVDHVLYALAWLSFAFLHSALLNQEARRRLLPVLGSRVRLAYTIVSLVHLAGVLGVGLWLFGVGPAFDLPLWGWIASGALVLAGSALLLAGFRPYDTRRFLGLSPDEETSDVLVVEGLNRWIRHPLYAGGVLFLWGLALSELGLATAVWGSLYLVIGAFVEERRLLRRFGQDYEDYRGTVPMFVPWKGRAIRE